MKVGRREFLKLIGAAVGSAAIPKGTEEQVPKAVEDLHEAEFEAVDQIVNTGPVDALDGSPCDPLESGRWHHLAISSGQLYIDGAGPLSLEEYTEALDIHLPQWYTPSWLVDATHELAKDLPDQPGSRQFPWGYEWAVSDLDEHDCPACQAVEDLHEAEFREAEQHPLPAEPGDVEYDCDFYLPISHGAQPHEWVDPITGATHHAILEWWDHGLHTTLRANGFNIGQVLSRDVPDPSAYLKSIWSCGLIAAGYMLVHPEGGERWPPQT